MGEIDVKSGYIGPINEIEIGLLQQVLPNFVIKQITFTNLHQHNLPLYSTLTSQRILSVDYYELPSYLAEIDDIVSPNVFTAPNIDLQRIILRPQNLFLNLFDTSTWSGLTQMVEWLETSPHLTEISMENLPSFLKLSGSDFIRAALSMSNNIWMSLLYYIQRMDFKQSLAFRVFTNYISARSLIKTFPNLTSLYYLAETQSGVTDHTTYIDELLNSLHNLQELIIFTDNQQVASSLGRYYIESPQITIHLV